MYNNNLFLNFVYKIIFLVLDFVFFKKNKMQWVIAISEGERFDGNAKALYEYYLRNKKNVNLKIIATNKHAKHIEKSDFVKWGSWEHFSVLLNSGVILYHHNAFDTGLLCLPFFRLNYRISHGIHYKKVERAERVPKSLYEKLISTKNIIPYHAVSSKQDGLSAVAYFHIFLDNVDVTGAAKNDILIREKLYDNYLDQEQRLKTLLNGKKLITYAPTWRSRGEAYKFDNKQVSEIEKFCIWLCWT
ncbi:hypothetical protein FC650_00860 [Vibrio natriegens]|uniref:CDP-glycerol glycerophosphotransferase family protein n=1 Tax=Vibrio natriegens TaxID=691 RepID=UPI001594408D|nr:CDP-glycerol glycerophosphotransferase family protein [Vibrio natriegens]NVC92213.1 hypothetical protein [Vibrio natriegens]